MTKLYKLVVTGAFNAGKTTFVNTLSDIEAVNTDKASHHQDEKKIKTSTTVALDYGHTRINDNLTVHVFGTPGQARFNFMHDTLAQGMHGFIFLVDSTDQQQLAQANKLLAGFKQRDNLPYLIAANKADKKRLSSDEIRKQLRLSKQHPIVPCTATNKRSVHAVVKQLVDMIEAG